jgi:hypothetical protein
MTPKRWILPIVVFTLACGATESGAGAMAQGSTRHATPNVDLPAAVTKAIEDNRPGAEIDKLDVEKEGGITFYDIEFKARQGEMDVAEDGTVLDIATIIEMKDVPEAAAAAIRKAARGASIKQLERSEVRAEIEKDGDRSRISRLASPKYVYEAELERGEVEVTADGQVIKGPK